MTKPKTVAAPKRTRKGPRKRVRAVVPVRPPPRPDPTSRELAAGQEALKRVLARRERPRVVAGTPGTTQSPHSDNVLFSAALLDVCGTTSPDFADLIIRQLSTALHREGADGVKNMNMALALLGGMRPENEVEALLCAQMMITHDAALRMLEIVKKELTPEAILVVGGFANRLLRTYVMQAEAFAKLRRGGGQVMRIEHVHLHAGSQAVIGSVTHETGGGGSTGENRNQPHEPAALAYAPVSPLRSGEPGGELVSGPCGEREEAVLAPRRRPRQRRA